MRFHHDALQAPASGPTSTRVSAPTATPAQPTWLAPFVPRRFGGLAIRQPDAQTLLANFLPRHVHLPPTESALVTVDAATQSRVLCHCHWQPLSVRKERLTVLLLHGLEGSSQSQYMLGNTDKAWRAGWNVIRMNMRNCGGTEGLAPTLYHSGLSGDVLAVAKHFVAREQLRAVALVGHSMGGSMVLKCAGELGANAPEWLRAVVGVSPAIDLAPGADALHALRNRLYEWNFLQNMLRRYRKKAKLFPGHFPMENLWRVRSIRTFDEYVVAPNCGFLGAEDYYDRAAASRVVDRIAVPTFILHAADDPFVRLLPETRAKLLANPFITFVETPHGGHCAFLAQPEGPYDGYWAEMALQRFLAMQVPAGHAAGHSASNGAY